MSQRAREAGAALLDTAYRGVRLATAAMLLRNAVLLAILAPRVLLACALPLALMLALSALLARNRRERGHPGLIDERLGQSAAGEPGDAPAPPDRGPEPALGFVAAAGLVAALIQSWYMDRP